jgi:hypothetical protein
MSENWSYESNNIKIYCYSISNGYYIGKKYYWVLIDKNNTQYNLEDKIIDTLYLTTEEINKVKEAKNNLKILKNENKLSKRIYDFIKGFGTINQKFE